MIKAKNKSWKNCRLLRFNAGCFCFLLICLLFIIDSVHASGHYQIVIHPDVKEESVSANLLRAIFSMRVKNWPNGMLIKVFVLADEDHLHHDFSKDKLNVFPYQLRQVWDRLVFSGTGQAPTKVSSSDEMLVKVVNTPGAVGYIETAYINDNIHILQIK